MHVNDIESVDLSTYHFNDVAILCYNQWKKIKGKHVDPLKQVIF